MNDGLTLLLLRQTFGFKKSLKFNLASINNNSFEVPSMLPPQTKIVDFHGRPKPHELTQWSIVAENWC
jgi:hypothetical protein